MHSAPTRGSREAWKVGYVAVPSMELGRRDGDSSSGMVPKVQES